MTETASVYVIDSEPLAGNPPPSALPCPFCQCTELLDGSWYIDDSEVEAWECSNCKAGAPKTVWAQRSGWTYPTGLQDMPAPGQRVYLFYQNDNGQRCGPVLCTPIHADGSHIVDGKSIYCRTLCWHPMPDEPDFT